MKTIYKRIIGISIFAIAVLCASTLEVMALTSVSSYGQAILFSGMIIIIFSIIGLAMYYLLKWMDL